MRQLSAVVSRRAGATASSRRCGTFQRLSAEAVAVSGRGRPLYVRWASRPPGSRCPFYATASSRRRGRNRWRHLHLSAPNALHSRRNPKSMHQTGDSNVPQQHSHYRSCTFRRSLSQLSVNTRLEAIGRVVWEGGSDQTEGGVGQAPTARGTIRPRRRPTTLARAHRARRPPLARQIHTPRLPRRPTPRLG